MSESSALIVGSGSETLSVSAAPASPLGAPAPTYGDTSVVRENSSQSDTASSALPIAVEFGLNQAEPRPDRDLGLQLVTGNGPQASAEGVNIGDSLGIELEMPNGRPAEQVQEGSPTSS